MAITKAEVNLRLFDDTALTDAAYSSANAQPFIDFADLKLDFNPPVNRATLEKNQWSLDGSKALLPDDLSALQYGFWSQNQSDISKNINVPLSINFDNTHTSIGLTLFFYEGDYATDIDISWFDASDNLIVTRNFINDREEFFADEAVANYKRIEITFNANNKVGHYIKISHIVFGADVFFKNKDIQTCKILEEIDPVTNKISINTMKVKVFLRDTDYIQAIYKVLQDQQQLIAAEYVNGVKKPLGTFYLTDRVNENENEIQFSSEDLIGSLRSQTYLGGMIDTTFENAVNALMADFGTSAYTISDELKPLNVKGYIPVVSHRRALQLLAFAVNAVVDCSRSDKINIFRLDTTLPQALTKDRYFVGGSQKELEKITSVQLNVKSYDQGIETIEAYKVTHVAGTYVAFFNEPLGNLTIINGTILNSNVNYAEFSTTGGEVVINGDRFNESIQLFVKDTPNLAAGVTRKRLKFENTILWDGNLNVDYLYNQSVDQTERNVSLLLQDESAANYLEVDGLYDKKIRGYATRLNIDLANGFIADTTIKGVIQ